MKRSLLDLSEGELSRKVVLVRIDANVPMEEGRITDDTRMREALPTIRFLCSSSAKIFLCSHLVSNKLVLVAQLSYSRACSVFDKECTAFIFLIKLQGRPKGCDERFSLAQIAGHLSALLELEVYAALLLKRECVCVYAWLPASSWHAFEFK